MNNIEIAWTILVDPKSAFAELDERPRFWFPLLGIVLISVGTLFWYYGIVDGEWLIDQMMSSDPKLDKLSQVDKNAMSFMMSKNMLMWSSISVVFIMVPLMHLFESIYFSLAGKISNFHRSFAHWLSLSCWSNWPNIFVILVMAVALLLNHNAQISLQKLNMLSLNEMVLHVPLGSRWFTLASTITLLHPWFWWLTVIGIQRWSQRSLKFSMFFALLPVVVAYGGWVLVTLLFF